MAFTECIVNDRPISFVSESDSETTALTPNMLIYGRNLRHNFHSTVSNADLNDPDYAYGKPGRLNSMCSKLRSTLAQIRKNFNADYLSYLRDRDRNRSKNSPANKYVLRAQVGDVVLIKLANNEVKLGRILQLVVSADGEVRSAIVQSGKSSQLHPIVHLRHFESCEPRSDDVPLDPLPSVAAVRPRRAAAVAAQQRWVASTLLVIPDMAP